MWKTLSLLILLFVVHAAHSEGGSCPAGYYPVGGQGSQGCAPLPAASAGGTYMPPDPGPQWTTTWGAFAVDNTVQAIGVATGLSTKAKAKRAAVKQCRKNGGTRSCVVWLSFHNQCGVMVAGDSHAVTQGAPTISSASELGIAYCQESTKNCKVIRVECSYPKRIR